MVYLVYTFVLSVDSCWSSQRQHEIHRENYSTTRRERLSSGEDVVSFLGTLESPCGASDMGGVMGGESRVSEYAGIDFAEEDREGQRPLFTESGKMRMRHMTSRVFWRG